jgi:receptor-interacting serine/threonine-protein kinase 4
MPNGLTPLFYEAWLGRKEACTALIYDGADAGIVSVNGETVLQRATLGNHADIVRLLLDCGVNINARDNHGYTAVLVAAIAGANECLRLLLKAGADISVVDNYGRNALHIAAWNGRKSTVRLLLRKGVDPKALDNRGTCALCWAVERRHDGVIRILKHARKNPVSRFIATLPSFPWRGRGKKFYAPVPIRAVAHHHHSA